MARSLGKGPIGYSQRTGRKVRYSDLVDDGQIKGLVVERDDADREHPQTFARPIPADRILLRRPMPESVIEPVTITYGWQATSDLYLGRQAVRGLSLQMGGFQLTITQDAAPAWVPIADSVEPGIAFNFETGEAYVSWSSGA